MTDHQEDELDDLIARFRRMSIPPSPNPAELLARLASARAGDKKTSSTAPHPLRRFLMRPAVRYLSAASLLLGAIGWLMGLSSSVALADVIKATSQHKLVRYQTQSIYHYKTREVFERKQIVYADLASPRLRYESTQRTMNDTVEASSVTVQDNQNDRSLLLSSHVLVVKEGQAENESQAKVIRLVKERGIAKKRAYLSKIAKGNRKPMHPDDLVKDRPLFDDLRELQGHADTLSTRVELDGRDALRYHLKEADRTTDLWADPRTKLPLRVECAIRTTDPQVTKLDLIYTNFEWDPKMPNPEQLFSTEPPPGYAVEDYRAMAAQAFKPKPEDPETKAVLKRLEEKIPMQFPNDTPLEDVLTYIRDATKGPNQAGIPFSFNEESMARVGKTPTSLVSIDIVDEPLKTSLTELLKPLSLTYEVKRGVLTIMAAPPDTPKKP